MPFGVGHGDSALGRLPVHGSRQTVTERGRRGLVPSDEFDEFDAVGRHATHRLTQYRYSFTLSPLYCRFSRSASDRYRLYVREYRL